MQASPQFATSLIQSEGPLKAFSGFDSVNPPDAVDDVCRTGSTQLFTDTEKRQAIDRAARLVERSFLNMHFVGGLRAATAYAEARNTWALMLMTWGPCVPELNQGEH